jgi:hypothetical protein
MKIADIRSNESEYLSLKLAFAKIIKWKTENAFLFAKLRQFKLLMKVCERVKGGDFSNPCPWLKILNLQLWLIYSIE